MQLLKTPEQLLQYLQLCGNAISMDAGKILVYGKNSDGLEHLVASLEDTLAVIAALEASQMFSLEKSQERIRKKLNQLVKG